MKLSWMCRRGAWSCGCPTRKSKLGLAQWKAPAPHYTRGYGRLFLDHILQANEGCDFDFLRGADREGDLTPLKRYPNPAL